MKTKNTQLATDRWLMAPKLARARGVISLAEAYQTGVFPTPNMKCFPAPSQDKVEEALAVLAEAAALGMK